MEETKLQQVINYFLSLKGLDIEEVDYRRYLRVGKSVLELAGGVEEAKALLDKTKDWADGSGLDWQMETAIKRYLFL